MLTIHSNLDGDIQWELGKKWVAPTSVDTVTATGKELLLVREWIKGIPKIFYPASTETWPGDFARYICYNMPEILTRMAMNPNLQHWGP